MQLHTLIKITDKTKRRLGQGHGSGRVKTSGRGTKGQKARGHIPLRFEGGALPLIKRLPFLRGKQKNKSFRPDATVVNMSQLNKLPSNTIVDAQALVKFNLLSTKEAKSSIKVLGEGDLTVALIVKVPVSRAAQVKIESAGGRIE